MITNVLLILSFIFPLTYLYLTYDPTEVSKLTLLAVFVPLLLFLASISIFKKRKIKKPANPFILTLLFMISLFTVSGLFSSADFISAVTTPASVGSLWLFFLLFLVLAGTNNLTFRQKYLELTLLGAVLVSLEVIFIYLGILPRTVILPSGSLLASAIYISVLSVYLLTLIASNYKEMKHIILYLIALILMASAGLFLAFHLTTDQKALLLPHQTAVSILGKMTADPKEFLFGVGPGQYLTAFTRYKPAEINYTPNWNVTFTSSSSFLLNLLTEGGILTGIFYLLLVALAIRNLRQNPPVALSLLTLLFLLAFFPANMTLLYLAFVLMAFTLNTSDSSNQNTWNLPIFTVYLLPVLFLTMLLLNGYLSVRNYLAEYYFKSSYDLLTEKNGAFIYNRQRNAVILNPFTDKYHLALSRTSLALADSFGQIATQSADNKQKVTKLAQQAIEEARTAVSLNRQNAVSWDNLSKIYGSLKNFAIGSEDWAIEAAQQKIKLDPANPNSYLTLGALYYSRDLNPEAEDAFRRAVSLKKDLPSARYNLGLVLKNQGKNDEAKREFEETLKLLPPNSPDQPKVRQELENLREL
ncbi:MAG: hypothetical protein UV73_C0005G0095 [Candidatus Gottesmanbacteria bacterium GW2011_GWA2_43_14]|uniref:Uncharacterized protein n=1 Tax=Candidatus Gottesmanbacteria bacterium GW2011_GWA2_43_14 TaxID=1618443 RepID=A0A0G1GG62_9BACT|nr:MAG: hypothetical protein UV73_C0005G0095 [Candidatus Gottesmanbacteria bacterium GW2011_GWA2_43_14]